MTAKTTVVQARRPGVKGYRAIGRPHLMGNPYALNAPHPTTGQPMPLADVLSLFESYLLHRLDTDEAFRTAFVALRGQVLGCPCPGAAQDASEGEACHGHVMMRVLDAMEKED